MLRFGKVLIFFPIILLVLALITWVIPQKEVLLFSLSPQASIRQMPPVEEFSSEVSAVYDNHLVQMPRLYIPEAEQQGVLGETTGDKRIEIDLTNQRLYAYESNNRVYDFLISSGKWGRTPTGTFNVWIKLRATKMEGGSKALRTYYYLPNVPYVMYFYNSSIPKYRGYGIHGTYWHNNFGHPMSHGCINMRTDEAGLLYNWAYVGIPVIIYGTAPAA